MGQGQLRVIIYIYFVELESILLHAKFHDHRTISSVRGVFRHNVDFFNNFIMPCSTVIKIISMRFLSFGHLFAKSGLVLMFLRKVIDSQRE